MEIKNKQLQEKFLNSFFKIGATKEGHFEYSAGDHGSQLIEWEAISEYKSLMFRLADEIAKVFHEAAVEAVVGPTRGGYILAQWVAFRMSYHQRRHILALGAEKTKTGDRVLVGGMVLRESLNKNILVVEDTINTGATAIKTIKAVKREGYKVVGVGAIWNRGSMNSKSLEIPELFCIINKELPKWPKEDCPLCKKGIPLGVYD